MKRVLVIVLTLMSAPLMASHIVGGEFELIHKGVEPVRGYYRYTLSLILYFDNLNGDEGAKRNPTVVRIYRKRDNMRMRDITLELSTDLQVSYKRPECSNGSSISTNRIYYTYIIGGVQGEILLDPAIYDDPEGYYISWERCCRNYSITNIYSEDPTGGSPRYAGQTFYLEFPPLVKDGVPFYNSSPTLFPPLSDYACPGRLYSVDFGGNDRDGDSLVYSMIVPVSTHAGVAIPFDGPGTAPYPNVLWKPNFGINNIMNGDPDLTISRTGKLNVIPTTAGLYVFAVKCEEFRNGEKIGEVRRDFQMLVLTSCPPATPPVIEGKKKTELAFKRTSLNVSFNNLTTDEDRCIDIRVTDPDATTIPQDIEIVAVAVNFDNDDVSEVLPELPTTQIRNGAAASFSVCFPQCPYTDGTYVLDILVLNESCGGALMDTLRVDVTVEPPVSTNPFFTPDGFSKVVREGGVPYEVQFTAEDLEDDITLIPPIDFDYAKYGFTLTTVSSSPKKITQSLRWDTECDKYDFSKKREFLFEFVVDDNDLCDVTPNDTLVFDLKRQIDDFHDPVIEYVPDPTLEKVTLTKKIYETILFDVKASDQDNDILILSGEGDDFSLPEYGAQFPTQTFTGTKIAPFSWPLNCDKININDKDQFHFYLIVRDNQNICGYDLADTLDVTVNVLPPDNIKPHLNIGGNDNDFETTLVLGEELSLPILGTDQDVAPLDRLILELIDAEGLEEPIGYTFDPGATSTTPVVGSFTWKPDCNIFKDGKFSNDYVFRFRVFDDRCFSDDADTLTVALNVRDQIIELSDFTPPNVVTPNNSIGKNDYFAMEKMADGVLVNILPADNCQSQFVNITILNRWGRTMYTSNSRDFRWYPDDEASGTYFYILTFSTREYKGTISVLNGGSERVNR